MAGDNFDALRKALTHPLLTCVGWHAPGLGELHDETGCGDHPDASRVIGMFLDVDPVPEEERPVPALDEADALAAYVAAANPDTIRALLAERDAPQAKVEAMEKALNDIAQWHDGPVAASHFDEPASAKIARAALAQPTGEKP